MLKTRARRKTKCLRNDKHALACEQALHLGSHETSRESHTRKETRVQRKGERKDLKTTTVIDPLYSNKKKMENVELFREFLNYKMAGTSCYIFLLVFFFRYFGLCTGFALATLDYPRTNVTSGGGLL